MMRPIPRVGESMPLFDEYQLCVSFVCAKRGGVISPVGTSFLVVLPYEKHTPEFAYLVTAAHCVRSEGDTWVRVQTKDGEVEDLPVRKWVFHPTEDVAVTPAPLNRRDYKWVAINSDRFDPRRSRSYPPLGAPVYFIGLLANVPEMGRRNVPMVRSGTLGAISQPGIPLRVSPETVLHVTAHLVDCRSYKGFSGSPVFIQSDGLFWLDDFTPSGTPTEPNMHPGESKEWADTFSVAGINSVWELAVKNGPLTMFAVREAWLQSNTRLLGLMTAHFPEPDDPMSHAGVGVVTPSERIWELLMTDEIREDRKQRTAEFRERERQTELGAAAQLDSAQDEPFSRADFDEALRKVSRRLTPSQSDEASSGT